MRQRYMIRPGLAAILALLAQGAAAPAGAQNAGILSSGDTLAATNQEIFRPLDLPDASATRTAAGEPGPEYWQNGADYRIRVELDPAEHRITGSEAVTYTNRSPHDLPFLWVQLDQNLFVPGSRGSLVNGGNRWRGAFEGGGVRLARVEVVHGGRRYQPERVVDGTRMRLDLEEPLPAGGGELVLEIDWAFVIPEYGADRMGRLLGEDGWVYELAQWYPRLYVYDDVHGWNSLPYLGQGEFYLEYGAFDVEITVPRDFIVVATGELTNPAEVLTAEQRARMERARSSAETVPIVAADEVGDPASRPPGGGPLTWRFRAEEVRDFAWAASPAFIWDAAGWRDVLIMSAYPREGLGTASQPGWEMSTQYARHSISHYSEQWYPYPYPVAINVAGVVGGMEYPMIVFCSVRARDRGLFGVTDHELGHSWFPMIVGSDERRYAWMDEGFDTFINHYSNQAYWGPDVVLRTRADYIASRMREPIADQPIATHPDELRRDGLGFLAYRKPGYGLVILREVVLGPERFDEAFRAYIRRWAYRHPTPADFFRTMEEVSGQDLDWFWRGWFHTTDLLDQAVDSVTVDGARSRIHLSNREGLVMPVVLDVETEGGAVRRLELPAEIWATSDLYTLELGETEVVGVTLDPDRVLPDIDDRNDRWGASAVTDERPHDLRPTTGLGGTLQRTGTKAGVVAKPVAADTSEGGG